MIDHFMHDLGPFPPPSPVTFFMFVHDQFLFSSKLLLFVWNYFRIKVRLRKFLSGELSLKLARGGGQALRIEQARGASTAARTDKGAVCCGYAFIQLYPYVFYEVHLQNLKNGVR